MQIRSINMKQVHFLYLIALAILSWSCQPDDGDGMMPCTNCGGDDLIEGEYDPTLYSFDLPSWMPEPIVPVDNPMTEEGIALGRMLFYDPILSSDSTLSCASCHRPELSFTDGRATSPGVLGEFGRRNSMALVNLAFNPNGFFWDGRSKTLEAQAIEPIIDHLEMNNTWENVEEKLRAHPQYPVYFRAAFGIDRKQEITRDLAVKAIAQFERTLVSAGSRYDRIIWAQEGFPTDEEQRGLELFFIEDASDLGHPGCSHCHFNPLFTDNLYKNNGLDDVAALEDFEDLGRGAITGNRFEYGRFRVPTLRNIALTGPYMHDGRFETLEEVLDNYTRGGHGVMNEDPNIHAFELSEQDKQDLIAFLNMLTDTNFVNNPAFQDPFLP